MESASEKSESSNSSIWDELKLERKNNRFIMSGMDKTGKATKEEMQHNKGKKIIDID